MDKRKNKKETKQPSWRKNEKSSKPFVNDELILRPLEVDVRDNDLSQALRVLKKKIGEDGVLKELRARRYSEKPSERRRRKKREAESRSRKSTRKIREVYSEDPNQPRSKVMRSVPLPEDPE